MTKCLLETCKNEAKPGAKYCSHACSRKAWKLANTKRMREIQEKQNETRRMKRAEASGAPVVVVKKLGYIERILSCRNPETHTYRCMSAAVARDEQMELGI